MTMDITELLERNAPGFEGEAHVRHSDGEGHDGVGDGDGGEGDGSHGDEGHGDEGQEPFADAFPDYEVEGELTEDDVWTALEDVEDPELPVSLVDLGLIRGVDIDDGAVSVAMTLTYTGCPAREIMLTMVERRLELVEEIESATAELDYTDPWTPADVTEAGREQLGDAGFACPLSGREE